MILASNKKSGFTIIEVVLVLAITGLMVLTAITTVSGTVSRQRYSDSVNSFRDFLREQYNSLLNSDISRRSTTTLNDCGDTTQRGRSTCLVLGKLLKFETDDSNQSSKVLTYDVVGKEIAAVAEYNIKTDDEYFRNQYLSLRVTNPKEHDLDWLARLTYKNNESEAGGGSSLTSTSSKFFVLIIRSELTGSIRTYINRNVPAPSSEGLDGVMRHLVGSRGGSYGDGSANLQSSAIFCVHPGGGGDIRNKRAVVIRPNGSNASAVEIAPLDVPTVMADGKTVEVVKCN